MKKAEKVYAIIEGYFDDEFSLVLVNDPNIYEDQVVFTYIDREVPTKYYEMEDLLEDWSPYNGAFIVGGCYGYIDKETGEVVEDEYESNDWYNLIVTYKNGKIVSEKYEKEP